MCSQVEFCLVCGCFLLECADCGTAMCNSCALEYVIKEDVCNRL